MVGEEDEDEDADADADSLLNEIVSERDIFFMLSRLGFCLCKKAESVICLCDGRREPASPS